jgi:NTP pyrophosphatase (non-canonical NTP hydrolase)
MTKFSTNGKEVMRGKTHIADGASPDAAEIIAQALNERSPNFIEDALKTCSPNWYGLKVAKAHFVHVLNDCIRAANQLDKIKKTLFYGRDNNLDPALGAAHIKNLPFMLGYDEPAIAVDLIHGILGKFTEAGELLEALKKALNADEALDFVNLEEEIGDGFWYDAIILNRTGGTFEEVQARIIRKLKARFPDKFTNEDANERNLAAERAILEDKVEPLPQDMSDLVSQFDKDEYADGDIEPTRVDIGIVPSVSASGKEAVEKAAKSAAQAFDNVGKVEPKPQPEIETTPDMAKPINEREAPMPNEGIAQENNPK